MLAAPGLQCKRAGGTRSPGIGRPRGGPREPAGGVRGPGRAPGQAEARSRWAGAQKAQSWCREVRARQTR